MKYAPDFTGNNAETFKSYKRHLKLNNFKDSTINTKLWKVYTFLKFHEGKNLDKITKSDIEDYILYRRQNNKPKTVHNDVVDLRLFFKWFSPDNDFFDGIKTRSPKNNLPVDELIVQEDVKKLVETCKTQRDRAIVMMLWDSAARANEILSLNIKNVQFDRHGCSIIVNGKTGMRKLRLIDSVPDLQAWINQHPFRDNPDAPLFVTSRNYGAEPKSLDIRTVQNMLKTNAENAGLKKNVHPHALRHGRLTELVKQGFKEMELRIFAGWEADSKMPAVYIHLSGDDVENKLLAINGIIEDDVEKKKEVLKPIKCPRCKTKNPHDAKYCSSCSMVLDMDTAIKLDSEFKLTDNKLSKFVEAQVNELVESRINEMLQNMK
ncbi:site-specific integrase [Methanococcoides alaskense]|uniref:Integrase n=1 Tax=Methanococcoides alaskense TaxID=325778 RepID=A0AA90Z9V5_9EURY|nr:site-specific integrase [Methanococcoides alaskense]MDA0524223.1 site-specific integrase [Methanococcoides alaskense]MDR6223654.1 integrase [Methanococcoides alaskense]